MTDFDPSRLPPVVFVTGTDTDVGKTYVGSLVAQALVAGGYRVAVYKPAASGCRETDAGLVAEDAVHLWRAAGQPRTLDDVCPQRFPAPLAPHQAARLDNRRLDQTLLRSGAMVWSRSEFDVLIVEGAGGLFSPISDADLNIDLAADFSAGIVLLVAANRLGVAHQTIATCSAAQAAGHPCHAVILSNVAESADLSVDQNEAMIRAFCDVPVIGEVAYRGASLPEDTIAWLVGRLTQAKSRATGKDAND